MITIIVVAVPIHCPTVMVTPTITAITAARASTIHMVIMVQCLQLSGRRRRHCRRRP